MKVKFAKLINPQTNKPLFMYPEDFERYKTYDIFKNTFVGYVYFDRIYINVFTGMMFDINEIKKYNEEAYELKEEEA